MRDPQGKATFPGFPPEAIQFFKGLSRHNTREWFQPRKELFEKHVKEPMVNLVNALNSELAGFAPEYVSDPKKAIFRIYRDIRFSSDKSPYKDHVAASFARRGSDKSGAGGFYISVSHKGLDMGGGVWRPSPQAMLAIRQHIAATHEEFRHILAGKQLRKLMGELVGDELTRVPKGFDSGHPAADLIKKKDWILFVKLEPSLVTAPKLFQEIVTRFRVMGPFVEYLNAPLRARKTTTYL